MKQFENTIQVLKGERRVAEALEFLERDDATTLQEQITITEIAAPPFQEENRAHYMLERLKELGLSNVTEDSEGNVYGTRKGIGKGPALFVCAHIDSVFSIETDVSVSEKNGVYYGAGICDDARGLAALLTLVRALNEVPIDTIGDIIFGATVGEEGPGDLRGVKAFFEEHPKEIDGFISIDFASPSAIVYKGTGSNRFRVTFEGPGGHSYNAFGTPSAVHAASRASVKFADMDVCTKPKTTFNVGVIEGGTIPTAIAEKCIMQIDIRSNGQSELTSMANTVYDYVEKACHEENERWGYTKENGIGYKVEKTGDRPVGDQEDDSVIVEVATLATRALGLTPTLEEASSTDANHPISLGIPSLTLGGGGEAGKYHTLQEWYKPVKSYLGPQRILLTMLGLVGTNSTKPLLTDVKKSTKV
ncbi:M20/M25/M40 family metallo-hydrolase [Geomicrobium sediminis]|uniref:Acetylornithine deacetylase/succinyl-diaminopimelate desuccinylase-like protein n=1 Tax=Geomicrobium sediminis TaxID=1347788 RepID=A0ABS2PA46_9BACL|nr:M20/M25/M40 family metallo-hydrolase [Geomicrobium sediminis]MBM7632287.1 acetylornithine deacetylase/succinyl-diaminopimelate desuccinylase-like protein [Geomicrobium sediminis]